MLTFEEFCAEDGEFTGERGSAFAAIFPQVSSQRDCTGRSASCI